MYLPIFDLFDDPIGFIESLLISLPAILIALSFHECAHGFVAYRCGDDTAKLMGRLTLNPLNHIDPAGFLMMILVGIGWAKPVPVNPLNYRNGRMDDFKVSIAGVATNYLLFLLSMLAYTAMYVFWSGEGTVSLYFYQFLSICARYNLVIMLFNLLPIPPLDGYHVLNDLVFKKSYFASVRAMQIGRVIIYAAAFTGVLSKFLGYGVDFFFFRTGEAFISMWIRLAEVIM